MNELDELLRDQRTQLNALWTNLRLMRQSLANRASVPISRKLLLLEMAEHLVRAHKAAKIDDNGVTLDFIEDALRHVGERLAREHGDARNFSRKRSGPV